MYAQHGFAIAAQRVRQVNLGHHHALEHIGRLADDNGVDVVPLKGRILQSIDCSLTDQARDGYVAALGGVLRLADTDHCCQLSHYARSRTVTRLCCRQGPLVAWATPRCASPAIMRLNTSPIRLRPDAIMRLPASTPPLGAT